MRSCSRSEAGVGVMVRFGLAGAAGGTIGVCNWNMLKLPQPASPTLAHSRTAATQRRRLIALLRRPANPSSSATHQLLVIIAAQHFNLPHMQYFNAWPRTCLHPATNPNPPILKGLGSNSGRFDRRYHAFCNSHSEVPCPVTPEIQVSHCSRLSYRQNLAFDHGKAPDPGQDIVRLSAFFMTLGSVQAPFLAMRASASAVINRSKHPLSATSGETNASPCASIC